MDDGTVLAVAGSPTPCATALAQYAKWGQTQPVTVTGTPGSVDNEPVLFVTSIQWAAAPDSFAAAAATATAAATPAPVAPAVTTAAAALPPTPTPPAKKSKRKSTGSASKQ